MKEIITDIELLNMPAEPLQFIDKDGNHEDEGRAIIAELAEVFEANPGLLALSAPQIGFNKRIFGIRFANEIKYFINPIITKKSGLSIAAETCASLPGKEILIGRPKEITVVYYTKDFKYEDNKLLDYAASIFDQMAQLIDGVLPNELGLVSDIETDGKFSDLTEDEMNQACEIWKKFVATKLSKAEEEIKSSEDLEKQYNQLKFTESVINGRTQVISDNPKMHKSLKQQQAESKANLNEFLRRKH